MSRRLCLAVICISALAAAQVPKSDPQTTPKKTDAGAPQEAPPDLAVRPVIRLGAASAKRGDTVPIQVDAANLDGAQVTLGTQIISPVPVPPRTLLMDIPLNQPLGPVNVVVTLAHRQYQAKDELNVLAAASEPGIDAIRP